jgi:hypothetical protein
MRTEKNGPYGSVNQVSSSKIANFTFVFGCKNGNGLRVDPN